MAASEKIEQEETLCPYCNKPVVSNWTKRGLLPSPDYTLVADWVFHQVCWDKIAAKY